MSKKLIIFISFISIFLLGSCSTKELDFNDPDVELFVKQLKEGTYNSTNEKGVIACPNFTEKDVPELLKYADDLTIIPSFPSVYKANTGKIRLGESILWVIEKIRLGYPPSLGCKMVLSNASNYEPAYFLTDKEVLKAVEYYKNWWENRQLPRTRWTIDPCFDNPLCGTAFRWW